MRGDVRGGFSMLHRALSEDRRKQFTNDHPDTAARKFVTLDTRTEDQFFLPIVQVGADEVGYALDVYRSQSGSSLTLTGFQAAFLARYECAELDFVFAVAIFELVSLKESVARIGATDFVAQLSANTLLDLCVVVEEALRAKLAKPGETTMFKRLAQRFSEERGWPDPSGLLREVNDNQGTDLTRCLKNLLSGKSEMSRSPCCGTERDLWITYAIRNSTAHRLAARRILAEELDPLSTAVLGTLFAVIENYYGDVGTAS
jgi:hypothetical protein